MAGDKCTLFLVTTTYLWTLTPARGDVEVSCVFMESCILPCSFQGGTDVVIHWSQVTGDTLIHSYYQNQDQLALQDQHFKGRTSLFKDQISRGNTSLRLTGVQVQDQGRYKCYTSIITGNKDSCINLRVHTPVRKVDIQQVENRITCSSEGIYPEPELTWSTSPPSNVTSENPTRVQNQQQLYSISSSLILSDGDTDLVYSCTVSSGRNKRRATLRQLSSISGSSTDTTIPCCPASNTSLLSFSLVWRFNHSEIILSRTEADHTVSEGWRQHVKGVSESGSLTLKDLSLKKQGIYTCELSNAEETHVTNSLLRTEKGSQTYVVGFIVAAGVISVVLLAALTTLLYRKYKKEQDRTLCYETFSCFVCRKQEEMNENRQSQSAEEGNVGEEGELCLQVLGSCATSDKRPRVMSLESASVGAEDYKSENENKMCRSGFREK